MTRPTKTIIQTTCYTIFLTALIIGGWECRKDSGVQTWYCGAGDKPSAVKATLKNGTLWIFGKGEMKEYCYFVDSLYPPWRNLVDAEINKLIIEEGVTYIGSAAFAGLSELKSVTIPHGVTLIGFDTFSGCTSLTSITIPGSVVSILRAAFKGCTGLISVMIEDGVTSILGAFSDCISLTSITIPRSVTLIRDNEFWGCTGLMSIEVVTDNTHYSSEDGVLFNKDKTVLMRCPPGRLGTYTIPGTVTAIKDEAFGGYSRLTSIEVAEDNAHYSSADGVLFNKDKSALIQYPPGRKGAYTIPRSVTHIGDRAFYLRTSLTSITIPRSVTTIGYSAFGACTSLTSITIPNSVTTIELGAFMDCADLMSVRIGKGVKFIGDLAFLGCTSLMSVTSLNPIPPFIVGGAFHGLPSSACLYVPKSSIKAYKQAQGWGESFNRIKPLEERPKL